MKPNTFVFLQGGLVTSVTDAAGKDLPDYVVIDYDLVENGECPACHDEIDPQNPACPHCGYEWDKQDGEEGICAIEAVLSMYPDDKEKEEIPLLWAAKQVVAHWESGDLAQAVRALDEAIKLQEGPQS